MSSHNFKVRPLSWDNIGKFTDNIRNQFGLGHQPYFPVMELIEKILDHRLGWTKFLVGSDTEMNGAEGLTSPTGDFIELREDVYEAACNGNGRARFTAAHELGHYFMHTNIPLARVQPGENVRPFELSEQQANQFAAEILMPRIFLNNRDTDIIIMERHGVSKQAANNRINSLRKKGVIS